MSAATHTNTPVEEPDIDHHDDPEDEELLLTIEEAAGVLRIGRSLAYDLARRYEVSGGITGIPNIRLSSGCRRVPRWALLELASTGRIVQLDHQLLP